MKTNKGKAVGTTKLISGRPELSLKEAAELFGCTVDDLIYKAAEGELTLYVVAEFWKAESVCSINLSPDLSDYESIFLSEFTDVGDLTKNAGTKSVEAHIEKLKPDGFGTSDFHDINDDDIPLGNFGVVFGKKGKFEMFYKVPLLGLWPIAKRTVSDYRNGANFMIISLDMKRKFDFPADTEELVVIPGPAILFQELINNDKLFVMKAALAGSSCPSTDVNLSVLSKHPNWPPELGMAIDAWLAVKDKDLQGKKPSFHIKKWIKDNHPKLESNAAISRLITITNWDKTPGPAELDE